MVLGTVAGPIVVLPIKSITSYAYTPRDSMSETLNVSAEGTPPKKRVEKLRAETPIKNGSAGAESTEVHVRDSIEFVRPASSRRNKTKSRVFDFTPPKYTARRIPNGIGNMGLSSPTPMFEGLQDESQRYSRSPYATHDAATNGVDRSNEYRPTTPFAQHHHVTSEQVFSPRRQRNMTPIPRTPQPPVFRRPPPGGHCNNIFG